MGRTLNIEIETDDRELLFEVFDTKSLDSETQAVLADGTIVRLGSMEIRKAYGVPEIAHLAIHLADGVGTGLASAWLYDRLMGKKAKLRINRKEVEITKESIRIVTEEIEREG